MMANFDEKGRYNPMYGLDVVVRKGGSVVSSEDYRVRTSKKEDTWRSMKSKYLGFRCCKDNKHDKSEV